MIVVDTQVHIWAPNTPERPWVLGPERAHLPVPLDAETVKMRQDMLAVLTPDQLAKVAQLQGQLRALRAERHNLLMGEPHDAP